MTFTSEVFPAFCNPINDNSISCLKKRLHNFYFLFVEKKNQNSNSTKKKKKPPQHTLHIEQLHQKIKNKTPDTMSSLHFAKNKTTMSYKGNKFLNKQIHSKEADSWIAPKHSKTPHQSQTAKSHLPPPPPTIHSAPKPAKTATFPPPTIKATAIEPHNRELEKRAQRRREEKAGIDLTFEAS